MACKFVCPICQDANVLFSGTAAVLILRSAQEWAAVFTCANSHTFSVPWGEAARELGVTNRAGLRDIKRSISKVGMIIDRLSKPQRSEHPQPQSAVEPGEWRRLQNEAQHERDPRRLAAIVDRMNRLLDEQEREATRRDGHSSAPLACWPEIS